MPDDHDRRYKRLFSHPGFVTRLLESFVDEPFLKQLDLSTLEQVNSGFVSPEFARRESDVIWKLSAGPSSLYLYLLIEFQSSVDRSMPLRFLRYLTEFYESLVTQHRRATELPAVFPLLLYNGDARWSAAGSVEQMIQPTIPQRYIPRLSYYKVLINEIPAQTLRRIGNAVSAVFYVENAAPEAASETIDALIDILKEEAPELRQRFTEWLRNYLAAQGLDLEAVRTTGDLQEVQAMFATRFQEYSRRLKDEGLREGRDEGLREGLDAARHDIATRLLDRGESAEEVARITGLTTDEVARLAKPR